MRSEIAITGALVLILLVASGPVAAASGVIGDAPQDHEQNSTNSTDPVATETVTETETETGGETASENSSESDDNASSVVAQVDRRIRVIDYRYNASRETFYVTLENIGDRDSELTITEVIGREEAGAGSFGIKRQEIRAGETVEIQVSAKRYSGAAAVMVTTALSIERGTGTYLQEDDRERYRAIKGEPSGAHVRSGALFGGIGSIIVMILGAWQYVAGKHDDEKNVDLSEDDGFSGILGRGDS